MITDNTSSKKFAELKTITNRCKSKRNKIKYGLNILLMYSNSYFKLSCYNHGCWHSSGVCCCPYLTEDFKSCTFE